MRFCHQCGAKGNEDDRFCAGCGGAFSSEPESASDPLIGRLIAGSYTIQELVGVGGMGRVYRAEQATLGRSVALKVIHPHLLGDEQTVARFYTEARAASRLNHPNSVGVIDFGRTDDGVLYLVMELLNGKDLAEIMATESPLPFDRILDIAIQTLEGLAEAHALDIVHRDLKPENLILTKYRSGKDLVKVVDFGLATIIDGGATNITRPGLVCGTPDYMAPEQGRGEDVDGRGDLYALGVILFELLTDRLPFMDDTPTKVVLRHLHDPVPDPREVAPYRNIPDRLAEITMKALTKDRNARFQNADEMKAALLELRDVVRRQAQGTECASCGAMNPSGVRFCGQCGTSILPPAPASSDSDERITNQNLSARETAETRASLGRIYGPRDLLEREEPLAWLRREFEELERGARWLDIQGEQGVGRTSLLRAFAAESEAAGAIVLIAGSEERVAPMPYETIAHVLASCEGVARDELRAHLGSIQMSAIARAGADELFEPRALLGFQRRSRAGAVAALVAELLYRDGDVRRRLLVIDDFAELDGLSQEVIQILRQFSFSTPLLIVTAGAPTNTAVDGRFALEGIAFAPAISARFGPKVGKYILGDGSRRYLPLYLTQLAHYLEHVDEGDEVPVRLAELILRRAGFLSPKALRVFQAAAILGRSGSMNALSKIVDEAELGQLVRVLECEAWLSVEGNRYRIVHPFVAELIEASIPSEARRELHDRAFGVLAEGGASPEHLAEHAYRGKNQMLALLHLERTGDAARLRGDYRGAIHAYRRADEIARRKVLELVDPVMESASLTFSQKLAEALLAAGELLSAEGILREALDRLGPSDPKRARFLLSIGRVLIARGRLREATRYLRMVLELVAGVDPELEARVQVEIAQLRLNSGDPGAAVLALRRSLSLFEEHGFAEEERMALLIQLAWAEWKAGQSSAELTIERIKALAAESGDPLSLGEVELLRGQMVQASGGDASGAYRSAASFFAKAGDIRALNPSEIAVA